MPTPGSFAGQYLSLRIGDADFGIPLLRVKEILQYEEPVAIPSVPASFRGVMNVRGSAVPVVDLAVRFGRAPSVPTKRTCTVVLENGPAPLTAVVADSVNEVVELRQEDVEPPPDFGPDVRVDYLTGMARHGRGFVLLLDIDRLLSTLEPARERVAVTVGA
jgi:purine-binding chemotaxis protein CheW